MGSCGDLVYLVWKHMEYSGIDLNSQNGKSPCFQTGLSFLIHF